LYHMKRGKKVVFKSIFFHRDIKKWLSNFELMVNFKQKMEMLMSANFDTHFRNNEII
jgi:hypothetical protein